MNFLKLILTSSIHSTFYSQAINAGNSGGPAIHNGKVVGVAFQGLKEADGIGYIIPASILLIVLREFRRKLTELIPAPSKRSEASSVPDSDSPSKCGPAPAVVESALGKSASLSTGALVPYLPSEQVKLPDFGHFDALIMKVEGTLPCLQCLPIVDP